MVHPVVEIQQPNQRSLFLSIRGPLVIGRECEGLLIADPQVSRRHLALDVVDGTVVVTDLASTNGSTIDDRPLTGPTTLQVGDVVRCGETTLTLDPDTVVRPPATVEASVADRRDAPRPAQPVPVSATPPAGQRVRSGPPSVGRSAIAVVAARAQQEGVDVEALDSHEGSVTIVFSDIEASTERNDALGDEAWLDVLEAHNAIVRRRVGQCDGTIVKNHADGFMLSFPGARRALDCMIAVQRDLVRGSNTAPDRAVRVRVGMHTGPVHADADRFEQHVVVAARIADVAVGSEILVSLPTRNTVASDDDLHFGEPRSVVLDGLGEATVHPVVWAAPDRR